MSQSTSETTEAVRTSFTRCDTPLKILAAADRERVAIIAREVPAGPQSASYTYGALHDDAQRASGTLRELGVASDDGVSILLPLTAEAVVATIAAMSVGVAFPVNPLLSAEALAAQFALARTKVMIIPAKAFDPDLYGRVHAAAAATKTVKAIVEVGEEPAANAYAWQDLLKRPGSKTAQDFAEADPMRAALLMHTGGSTGSPKLATLSQANVAAGAWMAKASADWRAHDRLLTGLPLFHVGGLIDVAFAAFCAGARVIFPGPRGYRDPVVVAQVWRIAEQQGATMLVAVPTSLSALSAIPVAGADLSLLRGVLTGGSMLAPELARKIEQMIGKPVYQLYGMTETAGIIAAQRTSGAFGPLNVGRPAPMIQISVGSPGEKPRVGLRGELLVRGPNVFSGYRDANTEERVCPADSWFATGDIVLVERGHQLRLVGRSKDTIIRSGHNIDPAMIEDAALTHSAVRDAGAVGMPDAHAGEVPVLFVALHPDGIADEETLLAHVAQEVSEPPARPKRVFIRKELPLTPFGKIARHVLRGEAIEHCVEAILRESGIMPLSIRCESSSEPDVTIVMPPQPRADHAHVAALISGLNLRVKVSS